MIVHKKKKKFNVGYIGNMHEVPEYILHNDNYNLMLIGHEKGKLSDDLLTFSLVRRIPLHEIGDNHDIEALFEDNKNVDFYIMCAFGLKIPKIALKAKDVYNIHFSNLPFYKGRHPTYWATIKDEKKLGISLHKVQETIDSGIIISNRIIDYYIWMSEGEAFKQLILEVPVLLTDLVGFLQSKHKGVPNSQGEYYKPVTEKEITIDIKKDSANIIYNKIRSQSRYKGAKIIVNNRIIWIKSIQFSRIKEKNALPGDLFTGMRGTKFLYMGNGLSIKLLQYEFEKQ